MPEYVECEAVNNILLTEKKIDRSRAYGEHECDLISFTYENARQLVNAVPAADVVAVVRCKDCKHRYELLCCYGEYDYGFCNHGERKE